MFTTNEQCYYNAYNKGPVILQWLLQIIKYITMTRTNGNYITMTRTNSNYITMTRTNGNYITMLTTNGQLYDNAYNTWLIVLQYLQVRTTFSTTYNE
jgi:hypothetical protein